MKLKRPKKIMIGTTLFFITYDNKSSGGHFNFGAHDITIGTKDIKVNPSSTFEIICHEIMEAVTVITNTRYADYGTAQDYKFFMTHKEFQTNIELFASVIKNFIQ